MKQNRIIKLHNLCVDYADGTRGADGISFSLYQNEHMAIVGESGSGKSTIAQAILRLLPSTARVTGDIHFKGQDLVSLPEKKMRRLRGKHIGYISQDPAAACNPVFRVKNHVAEAWRAHGNLVDRRQIITVLSKLGIANPATMADLYPHQWSGGMLQRAEIAAASAHTPALILADEPTSALDADLADRILELIVSQKSAVLMISHDIRLVAAFAQTVTVCYAGRIVEQGAATALLHHPRHPYTQALIAATPRSGGGLPQSLSGAIPDLKKKRSRGAHLPPAARWRLETALQSARYLWMAWRVGTIRVKVLSKWECLKRLLNERAKRMVVKVPLFVCAVWKKVMAARSGPKRSLKISTWNFSPAK